MNVPGLELKPWLQLARVSNLPTVWSNVLLGFGIALLDARASVVGGFFTLLGLIIGTSLLYAGGMVLNDACDARVDALHRPDRPIPSGRIGLAFEDFFKRRRRLRLGQIDAVNGLFQGLQKRSHNV